MPTQMNKNKIFKQHVTPNSSLHNWKIYSSEGCRKLVKDELLYMYVATQANTAVQNIWIFNRRYNYS